MSTHKKQRDWEWTPRAKRIAGWSLALATYAMYINGLLNWN